MFSLMPLLVSNVHIYASMYKWVHVDPRKTRNKPMGEGFFKKGKKNM